MKKNTRLMKICLAAVSAALICVATMIIQIPSPLGGYINFGDCFILVAAWILGPVYGFAAGGLGSALADLFTGYLIYVPGTFVIKGLIAVCAALLSRAIGKKSKLSLLVYPAGAVVGELVMCVGYYLYYALFLSGSFEGALASMPGNLIQGGAGVVCGVLLVQVLIKSRALSHIECYAAR